LTPASTNLWFVIDRLRPMPVDKLQHAGEALVHALRGMSPAVETTISLIAPDASARRVSDSASRDPAVP
jgi:DNA/RNA-binding domain of Phe-tRNA-synthetase-like protein